ncbi:MAG: MFS transporter, partial [Dehalococcoidia bacterium]
MRLSAGGNLFAALRHRQFALLWWGQAGSRVGDHIYTVVLPLWVRQETGSASAMGLVLLCTVLPAVLLMPVAGALVDRLSRPRVMFTSDLVRAGAALSIGLAEAAGVLELPFVLVASVAFGLAQAFFQPAYVAVVPQVTPKGD